MALEGNDTMELAVVLGIILVVMLYTGWRARVAPVPVAAGRTDDEDHEHHDAMLVKFVHHEGSVVGETVARDGDRLILKQAGVFKAVPVTQARLEGEEVRLSGPIDWVAATAAGAAWLEANRRGADDEIGGTLTRSEDVRAPALRATRRRDEEE